MTFIFNQYGLLFLLCRRSRCLSLGLLGCISCCDLGSRDFFRHFLGLISLHFFASRCGNSFLSFWNLHINNRIVAKLGCCRSHCRSWLRLSDTSTHRNDTVVRDRVLCHRSWSHIEAFSKYWSSNGGHSINDAELAKSRAVNLLTLWDYAIDDWLGNFLVVSHGLKQWWLLQLLQIGRPS